MEPSQDEQLVFDYVPGAAPSFNPNDPGFKDPVLQDVLLQEVYQLTKECYLFFRGVESKLATTSMTNSFLAMKTFVNTLAVYFEAVQDEKKALMLPILVWFSFSTRDPFSKLKGIRLGTFLSEEERKTIHTKLSRLFLICLTYVKAIDKKSTRTNTQMNEAIEGFETLRKTTDKYFG